MKRLITLDDFAAILEAYSASDDEADQPVRTVPVGDVGAWGIPMLDLALQADQVFPAIKWGTRRRDELLPGALLHFYTDDSKFGALLKDSSPVVRAKPAAVVEVNFSTGANMPGALVLYQLYQKRTLSAAWQAHGLPLFVDLNVDRRWFDVALLGVPDGWRAYANRAQTADLDHLVEAHRLACSRRGDDDLLYVVYGGGKKAKAFTEARGWVWLPEDSDGRRGRKIGA